MKILKWAAIAAGGLLLLLVVGLAIFAGTFDPNKYKWEIT